MTARLLLAVLLCVASVGAAQEAPVAPKVDCDTCQARHRGLQSLQAARAGAAVREQAVTGQPPQTRPAPTGVQSKDQTKE
ncbi:hypothetical protein rosmuc_02993 [Roseovarius mucosus DSM 17069]|uniref:Uncharacterized protein n=1 Tax=Roseovarius mucosus DSM 17069 TaxID=1288298 RepID=A0A0A0HHS7_9RHOB|nr:hypothetical protein [Roseovarius mucosus]KGM86700.1 hypothetical protein rosmuc_02993 [Roseovarius mucosus DSM 17069]